MAKTSEQMRQMVREYIAMTGVKYDDQTEMVRGKTDKIDWQFHVGSNIIVSKNAGRHDRIHINVNMRFIPDEAKLLVSSNPAFARTAIEASHIATVCGVGHQWITVGNEVAGLVIFAHVDEQVLDRVRFHEAWDNVARVSGHIQKILQANFGKFAKGGIQGVGSGSTPADPSSASSSIYG